MENSAPSLKIFRTKFSTSALYNCGNKNRRQNPVWEFTKTIIPFALVGYEVIISGYIVMISDQGYGSNSLGKRPDWGYFTA